MDLIRSVYHVGVLYCPLSTAWRAQVYLIQRVAWLAGSGIFSTGLC